MSKDVLHAPTASELLYRLRERLIGTLELYAALIAALVGVLVEYDHAGARASRYGDIGPGELAPPALNRRGVRGGIFEPVFGPWVLPDPATITVTGATSLRGCVAGKTYQPRAA